MKSASLNPSLRILIAGGGPAGASAAIRLAQKGFRVALVEREKFPREKLCGEFISPEAFSHFRALGVAEEMFAAGGARLSKTVFFAPSGKSVTVPSEWFNRNESALSLSRARMDFLLLEKAASAGVEVFEETRITGLLTENSSVCGVKARDERGAHFEIRADLTIDATGRARVLSRMAEKFFSTSDSRTAQKSKIKNQKSKDRNRLVAFKAHLKNACVEPDVCEIYFFRGGYGGLSRVESGLANHCFLIRAETVKKFGGDAEKIVREVVFQNRRAAETLGRAEAVSEWLAVGIESFGAKNLTPAPRLLAIGDAGAFIDPFTGSGMLMALESGEILSSAIAENRFSPGKIAACYRLAHEAKFRKRLRFCSVLRRAAFLPSLAGYAVSALSRSEPLLRFLARATRPETSA